jgi:GntR family transcriptional regulator
MYMSRSLAHDGDGHGGSRVIALRLREAVRDGRLRPGEPLPPIGAIAREFGTTTVTARRALRALEEEGLVRVTHGVGAFVAELAPDDLPHLPGFAAEMAAERLPVETQVCERRFGIVNAEAAARLGATRDALLHRLTRLRLVGGAPVAYQHSYVADSLREAVRRYAPEQSFYAVLGETAGRAPLAAEETLAPVPLPKEAARELRRPAGEPAWRMARVTADAAAAPLVYDEAFVPAERMEVRIHRCAARVEAEYRLRPPRPEEAPP